MNLDPGNSSLVETSPEATIRPLSWTRRLSTMLFTMFLTGITVTFYFLTEKASLEAADTWALIPEVTRGGQFWRLFTCHFVHVSTFSFVISLVVDFMLCRRVEEALGTLEVTLVTIAVLLTNSSITLLYFDGEVTFGFQGLFLGYLGAILGYVYVDRGSLKAFLKEPALRHYGFFLGLILAIELTVVGRFEPGGWSCLVVGFLMAWALTRTQWPISSLVLRGRIYTALILLVIGVLTWTALFPERARFIAMGTISAPPKEREVLLITDFDQDRVTDFTVFAEALGDDDELCRKRGIYWLRARQYEKASSDLLRATKKDPGDVLALAALGRAYLIQKNSLDAREVLTRAIEADEHGQYPELRYWLALTSYKKQRNQALKEFLKSSEGQEQLAVLRERAQVILAE